MDALLSVLPNLSVGVVSIGALVYIVIEFLKRMDERTTKHETAMKEREEALRTVEREIRAQLATQLSLSTAALTENAKVMERAIKQLDNR